MARRRKKSEWDTFASVLTWSIIALGAVIVGIFKMLVSFVNWAEKTHHNSQIKKQNKLNAGEIITGVAVGSSLANKNKKYKDDKLEKEMDLHGLNKQEKQEVCKGNYEVFNFEEENTEEDDYYHEDV